MSKNDFWSTGTLNKEQIGFLDGISNDARFSGGKSFSRTAIIRALLDVARKVSVDVNEVKGEKELKDRFLLAFEKYR
ncbi:MAG: hypothetical protein KAI70_03395 [Candidatus Omnitrophica bacterium]|nr:hypothetical protein [Candidatus Omnitrophota bacterium]